MPSAFRNVLNMASIISVADSPSKKRPFSEPALPNKRQRASSSGSQTYFDSASNLYDNESVHSEDASTISPDTGIDTPATQLTPKSPTSQCSTSITASTAISTSRPKTFKCPYPLCTKAFNRPSRLEDHKRTHTNERIYACTHDENCKKTFLRNEHLKQHIASAHSTSQPYKCSWPQCEKTCSTGTRLRRHEAMHEKKAQFACKGYPPCCEHFRREETLQRHIDAVHLNVLAFRCTKIDAETDQPCGAGFKSATGLRAHESRCHTGARFWCSICQSADTGLEDHSSGSDEADQLPNPPTEKKKEVAFATYAALQTHMSTLHPPTCPFASICGFVACSSRELQQHIDLSHSDLRPTAIANTSSIPVSDSSDPSLPQPSPQPQTHPCPISGCGKSFAKKGNLTIHVRAVHEKARNFECGGVDLSQSKGLETWKNEGACGGMFVSKQALADHVRRHHLPNSMPKKKAKLLVKEEKSKGKLDRKAKGEQRKRNIIESLVGRPMSIECVGSDCDIKCTSRDEVIAHCALVHDMDEADVLEALAEREALSGGRFWIGGDDEDSQLLEDDYTGLDEPALNVRTGQFNFGTSDSARDEEGGADDRHVSEMLSSYVNGDDHNVLSGNGDTEALTVGQTAKDNIDPALIDSQR